ncbi:MAG: enoyl-CoA hydratase/isomerase family protein [Bacillota bacterium]
MRTCVTVEKKEGICILKLNRPDSFNALNQVLIEELLAEVEGCARSSDTRVIVVTGTGKGFCAGGDLRHISEALPVPPSETLGRMTRFLHLLISDLRWMRQPVIAAINGTVAGAGLSLALACDLRVASDTAKFRQAYTSSGLVPDGGWTAFVPAVLGLGRAMQMALLDPVIDAQTALSWGLVHDICPQEEVMPKAVEWAQRLAEGSAVALGEAKMLLNRTALPILERVLEDERRAMMSVASSEEAREGINAFLEKRRPVFRR